ncbi:PREDICTED: TNF receptor-associated factor 4-like [Amphimedon queenslandica]|uniref:RING-type domain-containing protein n=2 Tax=Amphimedon queenslandica TaxID=400682 RepID=A0AAN0IRD4_AMPQE|nr:PREDICTED: TNF receptor-associated factor 4-like [Amphimedon queenslandica]|eukprot:XP_011408344.1 PREDICTED: TNF receptor-associated factor 4-like [Amphimedon queenslandica]
MATEVGAQGGCRYTFTDGETSQEYQCHICTLVARDPQQVTCCGKIYCKSCLESSKKKRQKLTCPDCNKQLTGKYFEDMRAEQEIKSLEIYCTNTDSGCQCKDIKDIDTHLSISCPYQQVPCTNGCGALVQRIEMEAHVTDDCQRSLVKCQHCQREGSRQLMTKVYSVSPDLLIFCYNF